MSDTAVSDPQATGRRVSRVSAMLHVLRRTPFTTAFVLAMVVVGILTQSLWVPAAEQPWFESVGTGLAAFSDGRWWSVFTALFFVGNPWVYLTLAPLLIGGTGWAEWRFGSLRTAALFLAGHVVGVVGAAALVLALQPTGWQWATHLATVYDVGPSCGALTALVFAIATLPSPWRLRARIAIFLWVTISVFYLGTIYDLEHAITMVVALTASGFLPAFRRPAGRPSEREWRLLAFAGIIAIGVIQVLDLVVPYDGPLGRNQPVASFIDVAIDVLVIAFIAGGLRLGHKLTWVVALILGCYNVLTGVLAMLALPLMLQYELIDAPIDIVGLALAPTVLWSGMLAVLLIGRGAFRVPLRRASRTLATDTLTRDELVRRLETFGGGTISWMTTWSLNKRIAAGSGAIAYQSHSGVAIMLGDPIVAAEHTGHALQDFANLTQRAGLVPCAFSVGEAAASARPAGWRSVIVAEDTIVDLPGLEFKGKSWGAVRTAINRASREGIEFRMVTLADEPWSVLAQVRAISEQWTGDKGLPEMRFTLGTVDEALDPRVLVGIAVDADGSLHGITSWLPVYGPHDPATGEPRIVGWTLDLMRRRDGAFAPVMEFLIASSAQHFAQQGYEFVSLSGAPLVRPADADTGPVDQVLAQIGELIEPLYGFKSLHRFKQKFNPRHASLHLLFRDEGDLPRIGIALTRAYLPDATLRDLVVSATAKPEPATTPGTTGARA